MLGGLLNYSWRSKPTPSKPNRVQPKVQMTKNELLFAVALTQIMNAYQASANVWNATEYCSESPWDCGLCPTTEECEERERKGNALTLGLALFGAFSLAMLCAIKLYVRCKSQENVAPAAAADNLNAPAVPEVVEGQPQPAIAQPVAVVVEPIQRPRTPSISSNESSYSVRENLPEESRKEGVSREISQIEGDQNETMQREGPLKKSVPNARI